MNDFVFEPNPWIRGGHAQTLYAYLFPGRQFPYRAVPHQIEFRDGDRTVLHEDRPDDWQPGDPAAILLHGLAGCHQSPYVNRTAGKLNAEGVRTFRMDHRGAGAGAGLAKRPYHAGRSGDLRDAVERVRELCPDSPISLVGFSLSGNIVLKYLGERPQDVPDEVTSAVAICPAADLPESQIQLRGALPALYDRYFTSHLLRLYQQFEPHVPVGLRLNGRKPRKLREFDDAVTAPLWGFETAGHYYEQVSAKQWLDRIEVPTLLLAAEDDPVIPVRSFQNVPVSRHVRLLLTPTGGHLGFISRRKSGDPDNRWMEWRTVDWIRQSGWKRPSRPTRREFDRVERQPEPQPEPVGSTA